MPFCVFPDEKSFSTATAVYNSYRERYDSSGILLVMNDSEISDLQRRVCREQKSEFVPCVGDSKLGLAIPTIGRTPINGLRHPPTADTNGWYIWAGDYSSDVNFFSPVHTEHLAERLPGVIKFLGLPPGSRFLLAGDYIDIWFDESLLTF